MSIGIYKITNTVNNKFYIGKSVELNTRLSKHRSELLGNYHENKHLQRSFNKYGANSFTFNVLFMCKEEELNKAEIDIIYLSECYKPSIGYNKTMGGDGQRPSEETRNKMSGTNNHFYGKKHNQETVSKMSKARLGKSPVNKFSQDKQQTIIDNWKTLNISQRDLAKIMCMSQSALRKTLLRAGLTPEVAPISAKQ